MGPILDWVMGNKMQTQTKSISINHWPVCYLPIKKTWPVVENRQRICGQEANIGKNCEINFKLLRE